MISHFVIVVVSGQPLIIVLFMLCETTKDQIIYRNVKYKILIANFKKQLINAVLSEYNTSRQA